MGAGRTRFPRCRETRNKVRPVDSVPSLGGKQFAASPTTPAFARLAISAFDGLPATHGMTAKNIAHLRHDFVVLQSIGDTRNDNVCARSTASCRLRAIGQHAGKSTNFGPASARRSRARPRFSESNSPVRVVKW